MIRAHATHARTWLHPPVCVWGGGGWVAGWLGGWVSACVCVWVGARARARECVCAC